MPSLSRFTVSLILSLLLTPAALASASTPDSARTQLDTFLADLDTLSADFQQVIYAPGQPQANSTAAGTLKLKRPDRFRWDYTRPTEQQIVADGISVWHYDPELEQVSVQFQTIALKGTPAKVLTGSDPVEKHFDVAEIGEREGLTWLLLSPREEEAHFEEIELGFADNLLQAMRMVDNFGQTIWFLFSDVEKNGQIDSGLFRFDPPAGHDVFRH